jgi:hypothetical protein
MSSEVLYLQYAYIELLIYQKFRAEDKQLSSTEAFMRRSDSLRRVNLFAIFLMLPNILIFFHNVRLQLSFNSIFCSFN